MRSMFRPTVFGMFAMILAELPALAVTAIPAADFLNSTGACVHLQHHQDASKLIAPLKFTGIRNVRDGADGNFNMSGFILLHQQAGVRVCFGPGSGAKDASLAKSIAACKELAAAGALLAAEGPNEPNNFGGVTYQGKNSNQLKSWIPVANYQKDFYTEVKADAVLKNYPVFGISEAGAEDDNAGLQFATIPADANTLMTAGTVYCDYINCHNYVCGHLRGQIDNQATLAAAVHPRVAIDHLFGNHGLTWRKHFNGYTEAELDKIPKVTTETGWKTDKTPAGDDTQGKVLMNVYLAQFKAGWKYTFIYEFADDSDGAFGFYESDLTTPRKSATYLHNLSTILADTGADTAPAQLDYTIPNQPETVHDLLLQKSDGTFELVIWGEQVKGVNQITVGFEKNFATARVFDPTIGTAAIRTFAGDGSLQLSVSDHVLIVEVPK